jgi:hypothetical protein
MARWHNLPPEIKHSILTQFSSDLVSDFAYSDPWESEEYHSVQDGQWSNHPPSLRSFSAALRTHRELFDSFTNVIKINGETPGVLLQREQYRIIRHLLDVYYEGDASGVNEIGFLYELAGCFWRHPDIYEDLDLLPSCGLPRCRKGYCFHTLSHGCCTMPAEICQPVSEDRSFS